MDPLQCNWEKTIGSFLSEANLCENYRSYLEACEAIDMPELDLDCCSWGCFNLMVLDGDVNVPWYDQVKCFIEVHFAYPGVDSCNKPPQQCNGDPADPTPPAAMGASE